MGKETYILGIAGGSGSGKTFFANTLHKRLGTHNSYLLYQDHYYKDQSDKFDKDGGSVNFDHPKALDFDLLSEHLKLLKQGLDVRIPQYDFKTHSRKHKSVLVQHRPIIIVDGILILSSPEVRKLLDDSIYVETPEEIRFQRRLIRDTTERGRTEEGVKAQFENQVKPMHNKFVSPSKIHATYKSSGVDMESFFKMLERINSKLESLNAPYIKDSHRLREVPLTI